MKFILLASMAASALAVPTGDEIFKRATSTFCKKAKSGCANTEEKEPVQNYCSSYMSLPPQKTKTFINLETSMVYTTTSTSTITSYVGSYSGGPVNTHTNWQTVTAAGASTTVVTENAAAAGYAFPSQCGGATNVQVNKRATVSQPACFSKYAVKAQITSACGCFTLTASVPATSLVDTTTTISTASLATTTTFINGPVDVTSTTTISIVTSTTTVASAATVTGFALQDQASGNYAAYMGDALGFTSGSLSGAAAWILADNGELSQATGYFAGAGSWQYAENSPDFVRFENQTMTNYPMNPVTCTIGGGSGQCTLNCVNNAYGWNQNCLYNEPNDSRNGGWVIAPNGIGFCSYVSAPVLVPVPS